MIVSQRCAPAIPSAHIGGRHGRCMFKQKPSTNFTRTLHRRPHLQIVATSEHWWEDEEEFDALTDALRKKVMVILTPSASGGDTAKRTTEIESLRSSLASLDFNAAFCSSDEINYATKLWAGRDNPPFFLKIRRRVTLDAPDRVSKFLEEALQQNWRLDLDAGLGLEEPPAENILVVCSGHVADSLLDALCGGSGNGSTKESLLPNVAVVAVEGTNAGDPADWKQLAKKIVLEENITSGHVLNM